MKRWIVYIDPGHQLIVDAENFDIEEGILVFEKDGECTQAFKEWVRMAEIEEEIIGD